MPKHFGHHLREMRNSHRQSPGSSIYPESIQEIRRSLYWILEEPDASSDVPRVLTIGVACLNVLLILLSLVSLVLETTPVFRETTSEDMWQNIEIVTTGCFTLGYVLRLWVCDVFGASAVEWFFKPLNLCDLLAILPVYAQTVVRQWDLEFLRVLRVVRLFKIGHYSEGVRMMNAALFNSLSALYVLIFLFVIGLVTFASAIYFTEKLACPDFALANLTEFVEYNAECENSRIGAVSYGSCCAYMCANMPAGSYPLCHSTFEAQAADAGSSEWKVEAMHDLDIDSVLTGMWWAAVTMTTVGYGDIYVKHWTSKLVASVTMVTGMLIIAMPFAIVGTKFSEAAGNCAVAELEIDEVQGEISTRGSSGSTGTIESPKTQAKQLVKQGSTKSLAEMEILLETLRSEVEEATALKREILQLQVLRDNLWTSLEHAMARMAFEGIISLNALMVDGPWFHAVSAQRRAKTTVISPFCAKSLGFIHRDWLIRRAAIEITTSWIFESLILFLIVANSFVLAVQNYYYDQENYWGNVLERETELVFTIFFTVECAMKIVACGFVAHPRAYLRDPWNWVDFTVVVVGLLGAMQVEAFEFLKPARVLRPLRSLSAVPGIRHLFRTIILSLPGLKDVVLLAVFLLVMFGVLGLHFWSGLLHRSCRLTAQPLHFTAAAASGSPCAGWCFDNTSVVSVSGTLVNSSLVFDTYCRPDAKCLDAWRSGNEYYLWPLDTQQERFCGEHSCERYAVGSESPDEVLRLLGSVQGSEVVTFCGSPLASDPEFGPEVVNQELAGINLNNWDLEVTGEGRNWGLTHFDNVAAAFLVVFQSVTLEGWSDIMGMVQDAQSTVVGFIYFLLLIVLGAFFLVNVILAIIWDVFLNVRERQLQEKEEEEAEAEKAISEDLQLTALADPSRGVTSVERHGCKDFLRHLIVTRGIIDPEEVLREESTWKFVKWSRLVATNWLFNAGVMAMILINVLVLAMDRYPEHLVESSVGDVLNYIFNIVFLLECVILHLALGPLVYWQDNAMAFDGVIVILSVVDILNDLASGAESGGSAITALRAFRMLRIFKLAKKFPSMKILLSAGVKTLMSMGDFVALLFLILCVFALMAQSFFGGTFMFDPENGSLVPKEEYRSRCPMGPGDKPVCVPRAHFDTFLWSFITIFQILTGENWNTVMYDGMRATGWMALWFFLLVVIFGNFVILNLFLAILMSNFDEQRSKLHEAMASKRELLRALETDSEEEAPVSPEGPRRAWEAQPGEEASGRPSALAVVPGAPAPAPGRSPRATPRSSRARTRMTVSALTARLDWQDHELACARRCGKRSCLVFSQESPVRKACLSLIKHPHFDQVIMVFIILSSILMAFENPLLDPSSIQVRVLEVLSTIFTCIFSFELVVKMIALGVVCNPEDPQQPRAYLRSFENALDFVIVIVSVLDAIQTWFLRGSNGGVIAVMKIFRVVRMLRPLRLISRNKNLKVVVKTILAAVPELRNLLVFSSIFFLIFGLLAVGNLKGSYHSCKDKELEDHDFQSLNMTPLCVETARGFNGSEGLQVLAQRPAEGCAPASEAWQRPSRDTPICEVHCDGSGHSFCQNSTQPWGYHVMRCSDCSAAFCSGSDSANHAACIQSCTRHEYFCKEVASAQREACLEQCVAACTCRQHCWGLIQDAALCTEQGGKWVNMNQNFDDLLVGTISLFEISTTEGWVDVMLAAVDSRGPYLQPRRDANEFIGSMLFVAFMLIGSFFVLNLCVGVIIDNYNKQKSASDAGYVLVTEMQAAWMTQMKALYLRRSFFTQVNVDRLGPSRQHRFRIITSSAFENFIMACILMQLCILMMVWQPRERQGSWEAFLSTCGLLFTVIFHIECLLKLSALHCNYFREPWNVFDFFCVVMSDVVAIIEAALTNSTVNLSALVSALRVFRVARLFRLVRFLKGLNKLLLAFALSVPKLLNVGLVMVLLLYLYAVLGVSLFAKVAYTGTGIYGPQTNFRSFFQAISLLIRSMTGEGFNEIMHDLSKSQWYYESILEIKCSELDLESRTFANLDLNGDGMVDDPTECGSALAYIYFISYTIFVSFVILNLFIAVIFEGFEESRGSELKEVINKCLENWERYDPFNTMLVALPKALDFIDETVEELMNAHQPSKGQCIPESRWDSRSTIDMNASEAMWSMYNLQYVRTLGLEIRSDGKVRLVQAVRAILRRLLIAGGPYTTFLPLQERRQRVRELEVLEAMVRSETEEDPAVAEIVALEARQKKQIQEALGEGALPMPSLPGHLQLSQLRALHPAVRREGVVEFSMLEKVAAAKIQRRSKESFQRRRDRARADHADSDARSFTHGPITRAAG
ncbi:unnamed protein product [Symbiodinium necroappetens]|uniref:Ion transport domain-containing protein n=1 Tax=Symbiodinium necroappetens TaxID=1628268 RepID=A0A812MWB7_9DINO|nr:unnamed protein product [Symbiodinium necroappetens]